MYRRLFQLRLPLLCLSVLAAFPGAARGQAIATGDLARNLALGGGGVALAGPGSSSSINPAAVARVDEPRVLLPQLVWTGSGSMADEITANLLKYRDVEHLPELGFGLTAAANRMRSQAEAALQWKGFEIGFTAGGQFATLPNAPLRRWTRQGHFGIPPGDARLITEFGYFVGVPITYARSVRLPGAASSHLDVGLRVLVLSGMSERDRFRVNRRGRIIRTLVVDVEGNCVDADLGLRWRPQNTPRAAFGLVMRGLLPAEIGRMERPLAFDAGASWHISRQLLAVVDLSELGLAGGATSRLSFGWEWRMDTTPLTLRLGVNPEGATVGFALGPLSFAYSQSGVGLLRTGIGF